MLTEAELQTRAMYEDPGFVKDYARYFSDYIECVLGEIHRVVKPSGIGHLLLRKGDFEVLELNQRSNTNVLVSAYLPNDFSALLARNGFEVLDFKEYSMHEGKESMMYFVKNH